MGKIAKFAIQAKPRRIPVFCWKISASIGLLIPVSIIYDTGIGQHQPVWYWKNRPTLHYHYKTGEIPDILFTNLRYWYDKKVDKKLEKYSSSLNLSPCCICFRDESLLWIERSRRRRVSTIRNVWRNSFWRRRFKFTNIFTKIFSDGCRFGDT